MVIRSRKSKGTYNEMTNRKKTNKYLQKTTHKTKY